MLRSLKTYHNGPITRKTTTLYNLVNEIQQSFNINSIYIDNKKENRSFQRIARTNTHSDKFNGKGKLTSFINQAKEYENHTKKCQKENHPFRKALSSLSCNYSKMNIDDDESDTKYNKRRIYTKEKLDFYDELFDKHIKIKKFKEDDLPFTKSKILPEIIWQKVENDIKTDDEQMSDAKEKLMNWLGDGIKLLKKDPKYFNEHIKKTHKGKSH